MNYVSTYITAMLLYGSFGVVSLVATSRGFARPPLLEHFILIAFGLMVAIPIHEAGHWLAGAAQGFRCLRFVVGPLEVARVARGWRAGNIPFRRAGAVYQVPSAFTNFRAQNATCLAAGPCLSLISCLIFTSIALGRTFEHSFWFWIVMAQMSLLGVLELVPLRFPQGESDGLQLWRLIRGGAAVDALQRDLLADSVNHTDLRPREWPDDLMRRIGNLPGDPDQLRYNRYLAYIHYLDAGDTRTAWSHLSHLLEVWEPGDGPNYALEAAYFLACHRQDLEGARKWLIREARLVGEPLRLRAQAAVEWAAGRNDEALRMIEQAQTRLHTLRSSGNREFELDCLRAIEEEIGVGARPSAIDERIDQQPAISIQQSAFGLPRS